MKSELSYLQRQRMSDGWRRPAVIVINAPNPPMLLHVLGMMPLDEPGLSLEVNWQTHRKGVTTHTKVTDNTMVVTTQLPSMDGIRDTPFVRTDESRPIGMKVARWLKQCFTEIHKRDDSRPLLARVRITPPKTVKSLRSQAQAS